MLVDCRTAHILQKWSANDGRLLNGIVLVEFTLRDGGIRAQTLRSHLVEFVSLNTDPAFSDRRKNHRLADRAFEQVRLYFDGDGDRENVFADDAPRKPRAALTPEEEADLAAELRSIEREFALAH